MNCESVGDFEHETSQHKTTNQEMRHQNDYTEGGDDVPGGHDTTRHDKNATLNDRKTIDVEDSSREHCRPSVWPQVLGAGVAALAQIGNGATVGFSGVMLPHLMNTSSHGLVLDQHQAALFSSVLNLGSGAGCLAGFVPMVLLGQRVTMLLLLPIFLTSWMVLSFSSSIWMLQVSRVVMGFTGGVMEVAAYGYATEIAHSSVRGALVGLVDTVRYMGLLLVYVLGCFSLTWRQVALLCGCLTTLPAFVFLAFLPSAPRWLVTKNRDEKARRSLSYFRGLHYDITMEMDAITRQVKDNQENSGMILTQLRQIREPTTLKIVIILAFLMISVQFTGNIVVISYVVPIFDAAEVDIDSSMSAVVVAMVRIVGTIFSLAVVDHLGRRPAIITSFLFTGMSLALLGVFFLLHSLDTNLSSFSWLPLALLTSFSFFSSVGHPVLNLVRGELLPTSVRSAVAPLLYVLFFVAMFLAAQTYPALAGAVGEHGTFWVYAGVSLLVAVVTALFIPETKAVTLENISFTTPFSRCIFRDNKKVEVAVRKSSQTVTST